MTLHTTKEAAMAQAGAVQIRPLVPEPVVVRYAAFKISAASYDEITRILRAREYHHVFDKSSGAIYMENIALTRGEQGAEFCSAFVLENNKPGDEHRYLNIDDEGIPYESQTIDDHTMRFARELDANSFAKLVANAGASTTWEPAPHLWG